ncbi:COQ9 family protein [Altererythrobacter endophyticus]|uniref:COQ9 family protein n=2 Tax=Altericroceibacterium endophyticum TaxID=1808508 RepID=A0A6I4T6U9_9SPHN|nr:COQ9 family protein [Altericroceibacterium endophyticum]MXO65932.1 COQ9 family protein [Altericroceibacterium endophyticum]
MQDYTLDELRLELAPQIAKAAVFDGWGKEALTSVAQRSGVDPAVLDLAFPGGAMDMIAAWVASVDDRMKRELSADILQTMPIRERIRALVQFRLDAVEGLEEALRRALAIQAMPQNVNRAMKLGWSSADVMWRLAGDNATDYNHYTKRATLAAIYGATLSVFISDESEDKRETRAFLDRRIEGVMRFEKFKGQLLRNRDGFSISRFLGRLRYPTT